MGMLLRRYHKNPTVEETTNSKGLVKNVRENSESDSADNE